MPHLPQQTGLLVLTWRPVGHQGVCAPPRYLALALRGPKSRPRARFMVEMFIPDAKELFPLTYEAEQPVGRQQPPLRSRASRLGAGEAAIPWTAVDDLRFAVCLLHTVCLPRASREPWDTGELWPLTFASGFTRQEGEWRRPTGPLLTAQSSSSSS